MNLILTIGTSGLVKSDLSLRFYADGVFDPTITTELIVSEITGSNGDYLVSELPSKSLSRVYILTWEYPVGIGGWYVYSLPTGQAPASLVLPVKETLTDPVAELDITIYKDGAAQIDSLTAEEIDSSGDYLVSGWPTEEPGLWTIRYVQSGISFRYDWTVAPALSGSYLQVKATQNPFAFAVDANSRNMFSANFRGIAYGLTSLENDIVLVLENENLADPGVNTFIGPNASIPAGDGPFILIRNTGGVTPDETHNGDTYTNVSFQIVVYSKSYTAGESLANSIWSVLQGRRNFQVAA